MLTRRRRQTAAKSNRLIDQWLPKKSNRRAGRRTALSSAVSIVRNGRLPRQPRIHHSVTPGQLAREYFKLFNRQGFSFGVHVDEPRVIRIINLGENRLDSIRKLH